MSDILDDLDALGPGSPPVQCRTCLAILQENALYAAINGAAANGATQLAISLVLQRHGYDVSEDSIRKHLKNGHQPL